MPEAMALTESNGHVIKHQAFGSSLTLMTTGALQLPSPSLPFFPLAALYSTLQLTFTTVFLLPLLIRPAWPGCCTGLASHSKKGVGGEYRAA